MDPSLVTVNLTDPDVGVVDGVTDHCVKLTETFWLLSEDGDTAPEDDPAVVFELEFEQAAVTRRSAASASPIQVLSRSISTPFRLR
jgi:hypothetical protein